MSVQSNLSDLNSSKIKVLFFDIDDTFSGGLFKGRHTHCILPEAYASLWKLKQAGIAVVPVTGRPAGWCDHIARMWPVDAIVGENGAFYAYLAQEKGHSRFKKVYLESKTTREKNAAKLLVLKKRILKHFKDVQYASDQLYREFDLAVDFCEDVPRWHVDQVEALIALCEKEGAVAKLSSIHVNTWFGKYDKWSCVKKVMEEKFGLNPVKNLNQIVYVGDSPNDEPFFREVPNSVGVLNVKNFWNKLKHKPKYVTSKESGLGFAELVDLLCRR